MGAVIRLSSAARSMLIYICIFPEYGREPSDTMYHSFVDFLAERSRKALVGLSSLVLLSSRGAQQFQIFGI